MLDNILVCEEKEIHEQVIQQVKLNNLNEEEYQRLATLFKMFADPTRLKILNILFQQECCVCDLVALLQMSQSAISHQLSVLRLNRLIKYRRAGKNVFYSLDDEHIKEIFESGCIHIKE